MWSLRNVFGDGPQPASALEKCFGAAPVGSHDRCYMGYQPFGALDGRQFAVTNAMFLQMAGTSWVHTMVDSGTGAAQVVAIQNPTATVGPHLKITTNAAQHDSNQIQYGIAKTLGSTTVSAYAPFVAKASYDIWFGMRFQITSTVANAVFLAGLSVVSSTLLSASVINTSDFIGFYKAASATMGGVVRTTTSTTTALRSTLAGTSFTPTISTIYDIGFHLRERNTIDFYVNGVPTSSATMTNLPANTVVLCPSIAFGAGTAAAATAEFHGAFWAQEVR